MSVAKTLGAGFHVCEVEDIGSVTESILGADERHAGFCGSLLMPTLGAPVMSRALFWPVSTRIVSNNLAIGAEQLRDGYFFVSDNADGFERFF